MRVIFNDIAEYVQSTKASMEKELDDTWVQSRDHIAYSLRKGKVVFDRKVLRKLKRQRVHTWQYILKANPLHILSSPVIYGMIIPLAVLDLTITLYQHICFRAYDIARVKRGDYFRFDRHKLPYLNTIQKLNCLYCAYGNGLLAYAREIIAKTEQYWCPIKHARKAKGAHKRSAKFVAYGDADAYKTQLVRIREDLK